MCACNQNAGFHVGGCPSAGYPTPHQYGYPYPYPGVYPGLPPAPQYVPVPVMSRPGGPWLPQPPQEPYNPGFNPDEFGGGCFGKQCGGLWRGEGSGGLLGLAEAVIDTAAGIARDISNGTDTTRAGCGKWKTDGVYEHKLCCTPSVGRGGVKVAACVKISRPYDPWSAPPPMVFGAPAWRPPLPVPQ